MDFIKNEFIDDEVLLMYRCGSYAFGTSNENSDEDYIVVLKDFKGMTHRNNGKKEYFIFGLRAWGMKMEFSDFYDEYNEIFNDEIMAFPDNLVYMSETIRPDVEKYISVFPSKIKIWCKKIYSYYDFFYSNNFIEKNMYHLIRIRSIVERYKATGSFSLELSSKVKEWIAKFKTAPDKKLYKNGLKAALDYFKKEAEA